MHKEDITFLVNIISLYLTSNLILNLYPSSSMARVRTMEKVYSEFVTADRAVIAVIATIDEDHR